MRARTAQAAAAPEVPLAFVREQEGSDMGLGFLF